MNVAIIGGGALGLSLAYFLAKSGIKVTVFEAKPRAGGLLDYVEFNGVSFDRYYHCILNSDADLLGLYREIGLGGQLRFRQTKQGIFSGGRVYPATSARELLSYPLLSPVERLRLGLTAFAALRTSDWRGLEGVGVEEWLVRLGGQGAFDRLWRPLLRAKFDASFERVPATYIWSRLRRTASTRAAAGQREEMGYALGGQRAFVEHLVRAIQTFGSEVLVSTPVEAITVEAGRVAGLVAGGMAHPFDAVVATIPVPLLAALLPAPLVEQLDVPPSEYLGIVCVLLVMSHGLSPYYTLNIADETPFTGIIETTNLIAPEAVGGYRLVYLPRYVGGDSQIFQLRDDEVAATFLSALAKMFPQLRPESIASVVVSRERYVEPLHAIGRRRPIMPMADGLVGLYVVNSAQIYPELTNCQASVRHARKAAELIAARSQGKAALRAEGSR